MEEIPGEIEDKGEYIERKEKDFTRWGLAQTPNNQLQTSHLDQTSAVFPIHDVRYMVLSVLL